MKPSPKEPTAGHTKTPWRTEYGRIYGQNPESETPDEILIADTAPENSALTDYDAANSELICLAVNHHAELVEALKNLYETVEWLTKSGNIKSPIEPHPYGLAVIMAKQSARALLTRLNAK